MKKRHGLIGMGIALVFIVIGSLFDLQISNTLYTGNTVINVLMTALIRYPGYGLMAMFGTAIVASTCKYLKNIFLRILFIGAAGFFVLYGAYNAGKQLYDYDALGLYAPQLFKIYIYAPTGVVMVAPMCYLGYLLSKKFIKCPFDFMVTTVSFCAIMGSFGTALFMKTWVARPRYALIGEYNESFDFFKNWWQPVSSAEKAQILSEYREEMLESFPSGHVISFGNLMFMLPLLSYFFPTLKNKCVYMFFGFFALDIVVGYFRIAQGGHYFSDVAFSLLIDSFAYFFACVVIEFIDINFFKKKKEVVAE